MINIAIIDNNKIYRESLRMVLEQVDDFMVMIVPHDAFCFQEPGASDTDIMLIDSDLFNSLQNKALRKSLAVLQTKSILLTMEADELPPGGDNLHSIRKGSTKQEFETMIREMITDDIVRNNPISS